MAHPASCSSGAGGSCGRGLKLRMSAAVLPLAPYAVVACTRTPVPFTVVAQFVHPGRYAAPFSEALTVVSRRELRVFTKENNYVLG